MKSIFFSALTLFAAITTSTAQDKKHETIEGNGKIVTREVPVSSFDALKASGIYELKLSQGNQESVKIEADENLQEYFQVHNEGSRLVIDMKKMENKNFKSKKGIRVYVSFKKLKEMELSTIGSVSSEDQLSFDNLALNNKSIGHVDLKIKADKFDLNNKSVGDVKLSGEAKEVTVKNTGVGSLEAGNFEVQTMDIENTGVGNATVNADKDLKVKDSSLGRVQNKGKATLRRINKVRV